jgi:hypothetical protein
MTNRYVFELQNCVRVFSRGRTKEEARQYIINNLQEYADSMMAECYVSEGEIVMAGVEKS